MTTSQAGRALVIHHDADSLGGIVVDHLATRGFEIDERRVTPFGRPDLPGDFDAVGPLDHHDLPALIVVLGSGSSVYDPHVQGWVQPELEMLRDADRRSVPVLGICFGHQLLAAAHGATVAPTPHPEIGWCHVEPEPDTPITAGPWFQWHLDHAELPIGAHSWASSPGGLQAFRLRSNIGVQFHPELDERVLSSWIATDRHWLETHDRDPEELLAQTSEHAIDARRRSVALFDRLLGEAGLDIAAPTATPPL